MNNITMAPQFTYIAIFFGLVLVSGVVAILYRLNTGIRREIKKTGDDKRIEDNLDEGDTLHAEGIYGKRHHEGGLPLRQEHEGKDLTAPELKSAKEEDERLTVELSNKRNTPYQGSKI